MLTFEAKARAKDCVRGNRVRRSNPACVPALERLTLQGLAANAFAIVAGVGTSQAAAKRLADMGFVRGARIQMVRPGTPCIVRLDGTFVGLGRGHQECILVSPMETSPA